MVIKQRHVHVRNSVHIHVDICKMLALYPNYSYTYAHLRTSAISTTMSNDYNTSRYGQSMAAKEILDI